MRTLNLVVACVLVMGGLALGQASGRREMVSLFDGKTLDGWVVKGGNARYHVEDGTIVGTTVKGSPNTFLCTKKDYGNFVLEFEVKVDPALNSGVQLRSHTYKKDTTLTVERNGQQRKQLRKAGTVYGYQVEIANAAGGVSGGIWDEARRAAWLYDARTNEAAGKAMKDNQWNEFRVLAVGDRIRTWVNGVACADFRDPLDQSGFIGLQVHSFNGDKPAQVRWRNIRIREFGVSTWRPLFDGKTLAGWHTLPGGKWQVEDGVIAGTSSSSEPRHGMLVTDESFSDFTVRLKFKAVKGNSGLYFRCEEVPEAVGVHGFQAEIDANVDVGGLYETGGRAWVVQPKPEDVDRWFKRGQWNDMAVSAHGGWIVVFVNGFKTAEVKNDPGRTQGHIALQMHGGKDMEVYFKDIEIMTPPARRGGGRAR